MKKTEVYSWRLEQHVKEALERAARAENTSIANLLSRIVREWLQASPELTDDMKAQKRVREEAAKYLGSVSGQDPSRSQRSSDQVKRILRQKHASQRAD